VVTVRLISRDGASAAYRIGAEPMVTYRTESGSVYDVEGLSVRRRIRSSVSKSERVSDEWREAQSVDFNGLGRSLIIVWGLGTDEHSANAVQVGDDSDGVRIRTTITTRVVAILEQEN
jgi:hypothetical protein